MTMSSPQSLISVIVVSFNTRDILRACLQRLFSVAEGLHLQVIVVDNASRDASADMVAQEFPGVHLIRSGINLGFAAANNLGFVAAQGDYVLLLNPDALLEPEALQLALSRMEADPGIGMGGGLLLGKDGQREPSARLFPSLLNELLVLSGLAARYPKSRFFGRFDRTWDDSDQAAAVDWVPGAFALMRREALDRVGAFDERFFLYYEEVDLCRRFHAQGWKIIYWPDVVIRHWGGESSKTVENQDFSSSGSQLTLWRMRSELLYYRKHHGALTTRAVALLESCWHRLRAWRARRQGQQRKAQESERVVALMRQAWRETDGGLSSPDRPW
jgi:GT2 family glycosyltransferase